MGHAVTVGSRQVTDALIFIMVHTVPLECWNQGCEMGGACSTDGTEIRLEKPYSDNLKITYHLTDTYVFVA
jgi:hypothetical protein